MPYGWCQAEGKDTRNKTQIPFYRTGAPVTLQLFGTVGAIHLILMENKALVGQIHGAFFAVEAVVVPGLSFIGHHTGAFTKPCGGNRSRQERQLSGHRWQPGCRLAHSWSRQARRLHPPGAHPPLHRALSPTPPGPEKMPELRRGPPALQNPHPQPPPSPCD